MISASRIAAWITENAGTIVLVAIAITAGVAGGLTQLEADSSLDQFNADSDERAAHAYTSANFAGSYGEGETAVVVAIEPRHDEHVSKESLLSTLRLQAAIRDHQDIGHTLSDDHPTVGIDTIVASILAREDEVEELRERAAALDRREESLEAANQSLREALSDVRYLQAEIAELNESHEAGEIDGATYRNETAAREDAINATTLEATAGLNASQANQFERAVRTLRATQSELSDLDPADFEDEAAYEAARDRLEGDIAAAKRDGTVGVLAGEYETLRADYAALWADRAALERDPQPPIDEQIAAIEEANQSTINETIVQLFDDPDAVAGGVAHQLLPADDPDPFSSDRRLIVVNQALTTDGEAHGLAALGDDHIRGQLEVRAVVAEWSDENGSAAVFGYGLLIEEIEGALVDSLLLVGIVALLCVLAILGLVLRDPVDIVLTVAGLVTVLVWTLGAMGWMGIVLNQAVVAVPILLIGLSIDYAIHLLYRHREHLDAGREGTESDMRSFRRAVAAVGVALVLVTATTATGFLSNVVSPVDPIRDFGIASAVGIVAALVVFGVVIPATKSLLLRRRDRPPRHLPSSQWAGRTIAPVGNAVAAASVRRPGVILVGVLLITAGSLALAPTVDTTLDEDDFLADSPPWVETIGPYSGGEPEVAAAMAEIDAHFDVDRPQAQILIRGDLNHPETMSRMAAAERVAADRETIAVTADGSPAVESPLTQMRETAAADDSFAARFALADSAGDGIPERNVAGLYDGLDTWAPVEAERVVHRSDDGDILAVRMVLEIEPSSEEASIAADVAAVAAAFEDGGAETTTEPDLRVTPTGDAVVAHQMERATLRAMGWSFLLTTAVVLAILVVAYRRPGGNAVLGAVTIAPVVVAVGWVLAAMAILDIPLNVLTAIIASLTVGLGVAFSIHITSRYRLERSRGRPIERALRRTVRGTGGAIVASGVTTMAGAIALGLATIPVLRQFGVVIVLMIGGTLLASLLVLPALLVMWSRYRGR